jgi:hypothetical protein
MLVKRSFYASLAAESPGWEMWASAMFGGWTDMKPSHLSERSRIERALELWEERLRTTPKPVWTLDAALSQIKFPQLGGGARVQFSISRAETCDAQRGKGPDNVR